MKNPSEAYQRLLEKARQHSQNGKIELAFAGYSKLIEKILAGAPDLIGAESKPIRFYGMPHRNGRACSAGAAIIPRLSKS